MAEKNVRVALREVLEELTGKPARLSCAHENSGEWSRCDLIFEPTRIGYRNPEGGASAGSTVWHSWRTEPAAREPRMVDGVAVPVEVAPAHTITPAEAVERLHERSLWPWAPGDDASPRWWCERCGWSGGMMIGWTPCDCCGSGQCFDIDTDADCIGSRSHPPTVAALVAVASLGDLTLRYAEGHARTLVGREPRVTFRVMTREALVRSAREASWLLLGRAPRTIAALASLTTDWSLDPRRVSDPPWWVCEAPDDVQRAWPVLRDLAALGIHLVALEGDWVTLAVEAVGSDR